MLIDSNLKHRLRKRVLRVWSSMRCSAKLAIAEIQQPEWHTMFCEKGEMRLRQPERHTMFCETGDCRDPATRTAYYVLRNWRLQGSGNPNGILCSAKLAIAGLRQPEWHTMFCESRDHGDLTTQTAEVNAGKATYF